METHGKDNPEAYLISQKIVQAGDALTAAVAMGGGHVAMLKPVK